MNLISCDGCGIVFDKDKIIFPPKYNKEYEIIYENVQWDGDQHLQKINCPVCNGIIMNID